MTGNTATLLAALQTSDMLEIDGLHAWDFSLDTDLLALAPDAITATTSLLRIDCMDGRARRYWTFSHGAVMAAQFDPDLQSWLILADDGAEHRIVCMAAFSAKDDGDEPADSDEDVDSAD